MAKTTIKDLLEAGVHFGHQTRRWNPKMKPYIYGARNGISIFDLTVTLKQLGQACAFLRDTVADGGNVLLVGTKRQAQEVVREAAEKTGMFYMCHRWLGGTLTNHNVVLSRVRRMRRLQQMETDGVTANMPKKEVAALRRELSKLQRNLGGIAAMQKIPAAMVVVDVKREAIAVREAHRLGVPVVAVVDSNCNPDMVDYVVPGNDDAVRAIKVVIDAFARAIAAGRAPREKSGDEAEAPAATAPEPAVPEPEAAASPEPPAETAQTEPAVPEPEAAASPEPPAETAQAEPVESPPETAATAAEPEAEAEQTNTEAKETEAAAADTPEDEPGAEPGPEAEVKA